MSAKRVLVQAGHISPREPGFLSGTGTIREQEFTRAIRNRIGSLLKADKRFAYIPQPGDLTDRPCEAAIFCHGDGSTNKAASGRSFGYPSHSTNVKLARLLEKHLGRIPGAPPDHADNYTGGLREYYGYRRISTPGPEVLIEFGFLTNPAEQRWMFKHLAEQATAVYRALCEFFDLKPIGEVKKKRLGWIVQWTDQQGKRHRKRTFSPKRLIDRLWADGVRKRLIVRREQPIPPSKRHS